MKPDYKEEIKILEKVYSEVMEALINKPETQDYEISRIYFENVSARMNNWAAMINKVKVELESAIPLKDITAENRPA